ncbi:TetR family transcriptional regulator [Parvibaculum lavamentivorans]|nr:TetR family transcriptional regulator [Parvibaculum lavamentivorans]
MPVDKSKSRKPQQRSAETRNALLAAATETFTSRGYDGVSIRALESAAKAQHGAVAYHFKNKETLWKAAIDQLLTKFATFVGPLQTTMDDLDHEARVRMAVAALVRFSAETPEFSRLMSQEGHFNTWRLQYLIDHFLRDGYEWLNKLFGLQGDPHTYYIVIGAVTQVFDVAHACRELFGVDPTSDTFIKEHISRVSDMILKLHPEGCS